MKVGAHYLQPQDFQMTIERYNGYQVHHKHKLTVFVAEYRYPRSVRINVIAISYRFWFKLVHIFFLQRYVNFSVYTENETDKLLSRCYTMCYIEATQLT